ncbi:unnamed protein product, partial [Amoebophrya sp. A25]
RGNARHLLDLERANEEVCLHYYGKGEVFHLVLSDRLRAHLQSTLQSAEKPASDVRVYDTGGDLECPSAGGFNWRALASGKLDVETKTTQGETATVENSSSIGAVSWTSNRPADNWQVFLGREIRQVSTGAAGAAQGGHGNVIQLVYYDSQAPQGADTIAAGPAGSTSDVTENPEDPAGWTPEEFAENRTFGLKIENADDDSNITVLKVLGDRKRAWRGAGWTGEGETAYPELTKDFGERAYSKAHRFVLKMYDINKDESCRKFEAAFFETFPKRKPPSDKVVFLEAEDGCRGTPCPAKLPGGRGDRSSIFGGMF